MVDLTQLPFVHQFLSQSNRGHAAVVEPHQRGHILRSVSHPLGFLHRHGEWFLTEHDLARLSGGDRNGCMEIVRSADVDNIDIFSSYYGFPIAATSSHPQRAAIPL